MKSKKIIFLSFVLVICLLIIVLAGEYKNTSSKELNGFKEDEPSRKAVNLTLVGDFLFEEPFYNSVRLGDDPSNYFAKVKDYFLDDDVSIGNMEVVIGNANLEVSGTGFNFCAPEYIGDLVSSLSLEVLGTINNHTYDRGLEGIKSTLDYFKNNTNILTVGTTLDDNYYVIKEVNGLKLGFLAYGYGTNQKVPSDERGYVSLFKDPDTKEILYEKMEREVNELKKKSDVIIVLMHWGREFTYEENEEQKTLAEFLNSLGVHLIVGSHSHSIEPIKWIKGENKTLVFYSLGNFTSADEDVSRAGEEFDNAYQVGLLAKLKILKEDNEIVIKDIKTEPIVNYYDTSFRHFELIPYSLYTSDYEKSHYRYSQNFNRDFIKKMYEKVISPEFR